MYKRYQANGSWRLVWLVVKSSFFLNFAAFSKQNASPRSIGIMTKEDSQTLRHISETLDEILMLLKMPSNKFQRLLDNTGKVISILGILVIIEIIRNWITGG